MPKAFDEHERELIKENLIAKAENIFETYGLKKTSVQDITNATGIAKGSFYSFYNSKEELFFEILQRFESKMRKTMLKCFNKKNINNKLLFKEYCLGMFKMAGESKIIKQVMEPKEIDYLLRKLSKEQYQQAVNNDNDFSKEIIDLLQKRTKIKKIDPKVLSGLFRSIFFSFFHQEEIGKSIFKEVLELQIDMMANYLIEE